MILTSYESRLLEAAKVLNSYDLEPRLKDHELLLNTLLPLNESLHDLKLEFPGWEVYSDSLMSKFILHTFSICNMLRGTDITIAAFKEPIKIKKIQDIPSIQVIQRSQLETFLMYHFIYVNPSSRDERFLRYCAWVYTARLKLKNLDLSKNASKSDKEANDKEMEEIRKAMESNPCFNILTPKQQKTLLEKGEDMMFKKWPDIMTETGFGKDFLFSKDLYHLLSSYAHSFGLSAMHIRVSQYGYNKNSEQGCLSCLYSKIQTALMIQSLTKLHKIIEIQFNALPQYTQDTVRVYCAIGKSKMNS